MLRGIPRILDQFRQRVPGIEVALHEMPSSEQIERLGHAGLSAGFVYGAPELASIMMQRDCFVHVEPSSKGEPPGHSPAGRGRRDIPDVPARCQPVNHDAVLGLFNRADIYPWLVHSIRNWLTMVAMVSEGHGMAIVCELLARLSCSGVRVLPLAGEQANAPASLVWHQASETPALRQFLACAEDVIRAHPDASRPVP